MFNRTCRSLDEAETRLATMNGGQADQFMRNTLAWQLYVLAYTLLLGLPLLIMPDFALPLLGFDPAPGPWTRLVGMFMLVLSYISYGLNRERAVAMLKYSIRVRLFIFIVLVSLAATMGPPVLYLIALLVGIGVVGSQCAHMKESGWMDKCRSAHCFGRGGQSGEQA